MHVRGYTMWCSKTSRDVGPPTRRPRERGQQLQVDSERTNFLIFFLRYDKLAVRPRHSCRDGSSAPSNVQHSAAAIRRRRQGASLLLGASYSALLPSRPSQCAHLTTGRISVTIGPRRSDRAVGFGPDPSIRKSSRPWGHATFLGASAFGGYAQPLEASMESSSKQ